MPAVRRAALLLAAALLAPPAAADDPDEPFAAVLRKMGRPGPVPADLRDGTQLHVPAGYVFVPSDRLADFARLFRFVPAGDEAGAVVALTGYWYVLIHYPDADPLGGQDKTRLDPDALRTHLSRQAAEANRRRDPAGLPAHRLAGWTHNPKFDAQTGRVTWGVRVAGQQGPSGAESEAVNYETLLAPPGGRPLLLSLWADANLGDKPVERTKELLDGFSFPATDDPYAALWYYAKIGGAGLGAVFLIMGLGRLLGGRSRPAAARAGPFGRG